MTTQVEACNRALQMAAARSTISAINDGSNEANNCNLLYDSVLKQTLSMARWNFARKMDNLELVRALPGTPESLFSGVAGGWVPSFPSIPWLYAYKYPADCVMFNYIVGQASPVTGVNQVPIFSTQQMTFQPYAMGVPQRFVVTTAEYPPSAMISAISKANPAVVTTRAAHGFSNGNSVEITNAVGMTQVNNQAFTIAGVTADTFQLVGVNSTAYNTYIGGGSALNLSGTNSRGSAIMTNAQGGIGTYTMLIEDLSLWEEGAVQAFISALAGFLAIPLSGDKKLAEQLIGIANKHILEARANDGNEGMTIQSHEADWIAARGYDGWPYGADTPYIAAYPPLFAVA